MTRDFCCCWLDDTLAKAYQTKDLVSLVELSVVFASPGVDPVALLPCTPDGRYIFHGNSESPNATDCVATQNGAQAIKILVYRRSMGWPR